MKLRPTLTHEMPEVVAIRQYDADQAAFPLVITLRVHGFHGWVFLPSQEEMEDILPLLLEQPPMTWVPMTSAPLPDQPLNPE